MDPEDLPAQIRSMSSAELLAGLRNIRTVVQSGEELTRRQRGHLVQTLLLLEKMQGAALDHLETQKKLAAQLRTENEMFKQQLLMDLEEYPMMTPEDKRKHRDRVWKFLGGDTPRDVKSEDLEKIEVSGHQFDQPKRFG